MYKPVDAIEVRVWDQTAGAVAFDPKLGYYAFEYAPSFIKSGIELAPIAMPLSGARDPFVFTDLPEPTFKRLPAMLADALPDDFGNHLIDAWMALHGIDKSDITSLDRLAYMGKRGIGALEFRPSRSPALASSTAIRLSKLIESARQAVEGKIGPDHLTKAALSQIIQVGTSAGGARAKAAVAWNPVTGEIRPGQFDVANGFEHWLLKFDGIGPDRELGGSEEYGRIEYAYYLMATAAGISMSQCRLLTENGRAHFMTRRFDRQGNKKHHVQTLCAIAGLDYRQRETHDYNQLFMVLKTLNLGYNAFEQMFKRMVFNALAMNCDDHTKNISLILKEGGGWDLAPAYDLTFAYNPKGDWTYQHLMAINGKFKGALKDDFLRVADRFGIGTAPKVLREVRDVVSAWPRFAVQAGVKNQVQRRIADHLRAADT